MLHLMRYIQFAALKQMRVTRWSSEVTLCDMCVHVCGQECRLTTQCWLPIGRVQLVFAPKVGAACSSRKATTSQRGFTIVWNTSWFERGDINCWMGCQTTRICRHCYDWLAFAIMVRAKNDMNNLWVANICMNDDTSFSNNSTAWANPYLWTTQWNTYVIR